MKQAVELWAADILHAWDDDSGEEPGGEQGGGGPAKCLECR